MSTNTKSIQDAVKRIVDQVETVVVGKRTVLEKVVLAVLVKGHVLFEDMPGLAKTLIAKSFAQAMGMDFNRVQFTPDLLPADITGTYVYNMRTGSFSLRKGPIFTNVLLADEINRAPPKTQAALLEAMQEYQTTLEGTSEKLPEPFFVLATQNPIEMEGTYPLPEAQLDRFLIRLEVGYPSHAHEVEVLRRRERRKQDEAPLKAVVNRQTILGLSKAVEEVHVDDDLKDYIVRLVQSTRQDERVEVGASPRGSLALLKLVKARAAMQGRDFATTDDVKDLAVEALAHRIILKPESILSGIKGQTIVRELLGKTQTPELAPEAKVASANGGKKKAQATAR
jgi:MoxR-like ATPase